MNDQPTKKIHFDVGEQVSLLFTSVRTCLPSLVLVGLFATLAFSTLMVVLGGIVVGLLFVFGVSPVQELPKIGLLLVQALSGNNVALLFGSGLTVFVALAVWILYHFAFSFVYTAPTQLALNVLRGQTPDAGAAVGKGFRLILKAGSTSFTISFLTVAVNIFFTVLPVLGLDGSLKSIISLLGFIAYFVTIAILSLMFAAWPAVIVNEGKGVSSLARSAELTLGYRPAILGFYLFVMLILGGLAAGVAISILLAGALVSIFAGATVGNIVGGVLGLCIGLPSLMGLIGATGFIPAVIYERLVLIKEGSMSNQTVEDVFG